MSSKPQHQSADRKYIRSVKLWPFGVNLALYYNYAEIMMSRGSFNGRTALGLRHYILEIIEAKCRTNVRLALQEVMVEFVRKKSCTKNSLYYTICMQKL